MSETLTAPTANGKVFHITPDMGWRGQTRKTNVALIGHSPSTRELAPWDDPSYEFWTMNDAQNFTGQRRIDRWFEIHIEELWRDPARRQGRFLQHLTEFGGPVYMDRHYEDIPNSVAYPFEEYFAKYGRGVFGSSFGYLIAMAIEEGFTRIEMYGCDLSSEEEYKKQRESTAFWIGMVRGLGREFILPEATPLLRAQPYGRGRVIVPGLTEETINTRIAQLKNAASAAQTEAVKLSGAIEDTIWWRAKVSELVEQ